MDKTTVFVDVCVDLSDSEDVKTWRETMKEHGLKYRTLQKVGPGGGWPLMAVTGERRAVKKWLLFFFDGDKEQADFIMKEYSSKS